MNRVRVLWVRVWGIAAVQGAITLCWVIYNLYLPGMLIQMGFTKEFSVAILVIEKFLEAAIEPIFGWYSDGTLRLKGTRLPIITTGILTSSVLFITIPCAVIFLPSFKWLLPVLAVFWASAMAIFRPPVMALLGKCSPREELPQAASVLSLVGSFVGALRFDAYGTILNVGAGFAFAIGSVVLLIAGFTLRWLNPPVIPLQSNRQSLTSRSRLSLLFVTGIFAGWGLRFLIPVIREILTNQVGSENTKFAMTGFFLILGLLSLPAGRIGTKFGNLRTMIGGCCLVILMAILGVAISNKYSIFLVLLLLILGLSLVLNGAVPYALNLVAKSSSGLGVGMYFGGFAAGVGLFEFIFSQLEITQTDVGIWGIGCSFGLLLCCLLWSNKLERFSEV